MLRSVFKNNTEISVRSCLEMALGSRPFDSDHVPVFLDPSVMCMLGGWRGIEDRLGRSNGTHSTINGGVFLSDHSPAVSPEQSL